MRHPNLFWIAVAIIFAIAVLPWQKHTAKVTAAVQASALSQDQQSKLAEIPLSYPMKTDKGDTLFVFGERLLGKRLPCTATWYQSPLGLTKTEYRITQ